jgi:hypothetical protein
MDFTDLKDDDDTYVLAPPKVEFGSGVPPPQPPGMVSIPPTQPGIPGAPPLPQGVAPPTTLTRWYWPTTTTPPPPMGGVAFRPAVDLPPPPRADLHKNKRLRKFTGKMFNLNILIRQRKGRQFGRILLK